MRCALGEILMNKKRLPIVIGIVVVVAVLIVVFDTLLTNHQPSISSLAAPERVVPSGSCQIVCNATDRDGDALSYNWSASAGQLAGEGAAVTWDAPDSIGVYNITVAVTDGRGGEVVQQVTILVRTNRTPSITDLAADASWTLPLGTVQLTCTASDPDGDELSYEWTTSAGDIPGTGAAVNWTAPEEVGLYYLAVVVKDSHGSSDTRTLSLTVAQEEPPIVEELRVTAEHCYLKAYSWGYKVGKAQEYHVQCIVSDNSSVVSYNWSCDDGEMSGEGSTITWTAPNASVDVTITVIVSDVSGNVASKDLALDVVNCSPCTFGC
jgi:hypothetical protein